MSDSPMCTKACLAVFSDKSSLQYYEKREVALSKRSRAGDHCLAVHVSRRHGIAWSILNSGPRDDAPELLERDQRLVPPRAHHAEGAPRVDPKNGCEPGGEDALRRGSFHGGGR